MIIRNRFESDQARNMKIGLMIASSVGYMIMLSGSTSTVLEYFHKIWYWFMAGDILISSEFGYLNEVPMAKYLDTFTTGDNPAVTSYMF